jgi:hypothetical protein
MLCNIKEIAATAEMSLAFEGNPLRTIPSFYQDRSSKPYRICRKVKGCSVASPLKCNCLHVQLYNALLQNFGALKTLIFKPVSETNKSVLFVFTNLGLGPGLNLRFLKICNSGP